MPVSLKVFSADPCVALQRGTYENANGLFRNHFPQGTDFRRVTDQALQAAVDSLKHRPRKRLDFRTPHGVFSEAAAAALANGIHPPRARSAQKRSARPTLASICQIAPPLAPTKQTPPPPPLEQATSELSDTKMP